MNPLVTAFIGAAVRWLVTALASRGVAVSNDEASQAIYGLIAIGTLLWSLRQKKQTDAKIKEVAATGVV